MIEFDDRSLHAEIFTANNLLPNFQRHGMDLTVDGLSGGTLPAT